MARPRTPPWSHAHGQTLCRRCGGHPGRRAAAQAHVGGHVIREGDMITIDGSSGNVYLGQVPMVEPEFSDELKELLQWADDVAYLR